MPRYQINQSKFLEKSELSHVESICYLSISKGDFVNYRNGLIILLALKTGARASEILSICKENVNFKNKSIFIKGIKNSDDREITLHHKIFALLKSYTENFNIKNGEYLFPISYQRLNQIWNEYKPCHKRFHSTRHTFAIELYKKTRDIKLVQVALGHRSLNNTQVYSEYIYKKEELKKAVLK